MNARRRSLQAVDALAYAVLITVVLFVVTTVVSLLFGWGLVGTKHLLFFAGFAMFGYGAFGLQPARPWKDGRRSKNDELRGLQRFAERRLPTRYRLEPNDRLSTASKLFVASFFVLGTSAAMEFVFGINGV